MAAVIEQARPRSIEAMRSTNASASFNRRSENICVEPIVISELKLRYVQRQIFLAHFVETADDAPLKDAPEAFNRVGVNRANDVTTGLVIDALVRPAILSESMIRASLIGSDQAHFVANHFLHKPFGTLPSDLIENAGDHVALTLHSADHRHLTGTAAAAPTVTALAMFVVGFATNPCLINLDNAAEFGFRLDESRADFVAHAPSRPVRAKAHYALDLEGADTLFAGEHRVRDAKPLLERLVRVLKNGA